MRPQILLLVNAHNLQWMNAIQWEQSARVCMKIDSRHGSICVHHDEEWRIHTCSYQKTEHWFEEARQEFESVALESCQQYDRCGRAHICMYILTSFCEIHKTRRSYIVYGKVLMFAIRNRNSRFNAKKRQTQISLRSVWSGGIAVQSLHSKCC